MYCNSSTCKNNKSNYLTKMCLSTGYNSRFIGTWVVKILTWYSLFSYRGESTIEASPEVVFEYVDPTPDGPRVSWDKAIKRLEIVEQIDEVGSYCIFSNHLQFTLIWTQQTLTLSLTVEQYYYVIIHYFGQRYIFYIVITYVTFHVVII